MKKTVLLVLLSFVVSSTVWAHSTSIDMALQSINGALEQYEQTNKDAKYYALDSWIQNSEFKVELTQMTPLLDLASYTCHHEDEDGHGEHQMMVDCKLDKQSKPDGSLVTESNTKANHVLAIESATAHFKNASKDRPADQLMQGFWNIRSYQKAGMTKVKVRSAIAGSANTFREFTYSCNKDQVMGCSQVAEEKIVERKAN